MLIDIKYEKGKGTCYSILSGKRPDFYSDGASVPRIFWWICTPFDARYLKIFEKHDWLYTIGYDRSAADQILKSELIEAGMSKIKAWIIFLAVRLFGKRHWN